MDSYTVSDGSSGAGSFNVVNPATGEVETQHRGLFDRSPSRAGAATLEPSASQFGEFRSAQNSENQSQQQFQSGAPHSTMPASNAFPQPPGSIGTTGLQPHESSGTFVQGQQGYDIGGLHGNPMQMQGRGTNTHQHGATSQELSAPQGAGSSSGGGLQASQFAGPTFAQAQQYRGLSHHFPNPHSAWQHQGFQQQVPMGWSQPAISSSSLVGDNDFLY